jgi:hypothetical protein
MSYTDDAQSSTTLTRPPLPVIIGGIIILLIVIGGCVTGYLILGRGGGQAAGGPPTRILPPTSTPAPPTLTPPPTTPAEGIGGGGDESPTPSLTPTSTEVPPTATPTFRSANLTEIKGKVRIKRPGETDFTTITSDVLDLRTGTIIETGEKSSAKLTLVEGTVIRIGHQTTLTLTDLGGSFLEPITHLTMKGGRVYAILGLELGAGRFEIETPLGTAETSDTGTFLGVEHNTNEVVDIITCLHSDGKCAYKNESGAIDLLTGQEIQTHSEDEVLGPIVVIDPTQIANWAPTRVTEVVTLTATVTPTFTASETRTPTLTRTPSNTPNIPGTQSAFGTRVALTGTAVSANLTSTVFFIQLTATNQANTTAGARTATAAVATANAGATGAFYTATAVQLTQVAAQSNATATARAQQTGTAAAQLTANANATNVILTGTAAATATNIAATNAAATQTATAFPKFTFSVGTLQVNENAGTVPITVNLSPTLNASSSITVVAVDGSATSPTDYSFTTVTVPFLANQSTATVNVNIVDSPLTNEPDETFSLLLTTPSAGTGLGTPASIVITIKDVAAPTFTLSAATYTGTESSGKITVTVNLNIPPTAGTRDVTLSTAATGGSSTDATPVVDFTSVNQVLSFSVGQTSKTVDITVIDDGLAESDETFQVLLSNPVGGVVGSPGSAIATIQDSPQASVGFTAGSYTFAEGSGGGATVVTIPVTLSRAYANGPGATVNYSVLGSSTAVGGAACGGVVDYQTPVAGALTFPAGATTPTVPLQITICADNLNEADDRIDLTLSNPVNAALGVATTTVTITNDDNPPAVVLNTATVNVGEPGGLGATTTVAITASLTGTSGQTITVNYATADVTATNGVDYVGVTGTLTFNPGSTTPMTQIPAITVNGDILNETTEAFTLALSNPTGGATVGAPGTATVNIADDGDAPPTVTFSAVPYITPEGNASGTVTITVNFDRPSGQTVSLGYGTSAGPITCGNPATAGVDYQVTSGTLTFNPGDMSKTFAVTINGDTTAEPNECFALNLGLSSGAANNLPTNSEVWIQNDD